MSAATMTNLQITFATVNHITSEPGNTPYESPISGSGIILDIRRRIEADDGLPEALAVPLSKSSQIRGQKQRQ
jgi:hypothetical protein